MTVGPTVINIKQLVALGLALVLFSLALEVSFRELAPAARWSSSAERFRSC